MALLGHLMNVWVEEMQHRAFAGYRRRGDA